MNSMISITQMEIQYITTIISHQYFFSQYLFDLYVFNDYIPSPLMIRRIQQLYQLHGY